MEFEPARPDELQAVRELLRTAGLPDDDLDSQHMSDFLVARSAATLRACVGMERLGDVALLRSLAVRREDRSKGFGSKALRSIEQRAGAAGVQRLYLLTTTAAGFFGAHGFSPCERSAAPASIRATREFESVCPTSAECLSKTL